MHTSEAETEGIRVRVESEFDAEYSDPGEGRWFFVYRIRIDNGSDRTVQLLSRHWVITDGDGDVEEIRGPGVVGEQPVLRPGETHAYSSGCPLPTPFGTMHGSYRMVDDRGREFDVRIAPFALAEPYAIN